MKVDLHVHTAERSRCGRAMAVDQIEAARAAGLDAIVLTDHARFAPEEDLADWNRQFAPFRVFGGIEMSVDGEDLIVLGVREPRLESDAWTYPELHACVRAAGGFLALAHPFRYRDHVAVDLARWPVDAVEVRSGNTPPQAADRIEAMARELGIPTLCNSDAHEPTALGRFYNRLDRTPRDEADLIALLRAGRFRGVADGAGSLGS